MRLTLLGTALFGLLFSIAVSAPLQADEIRVGIIGLDTGHVIAFTKTMNDENAEGVLKKCRVVAAYPEGSHRRDSEIRSRDRGFHSRSSGKS